MTIAMAPSDPVLPDLAVLDPELTLGLPPHVTAATGIDAMVHAIEAFTSKNKKNPISDQLAKQALALLSANIRTACTDGKNLEARSGMLLGSMLAGMAFANAPVAAVHALAYPVGAIFHVPHGLSNALVLMGVMRFNLSHARSLIACAVAYDAEVGVDVEETDRGIEALELAERFFAPSEVAHLRAAPSDIRDERFFTLWTLKEAYIKALGTGLSTDLKAFAIDPVRPGFADGDDRWHFAAAAPTPRHALAICVRRTDAAPNLVLRETVPGAQ